MTKKNDFIWKLIQTICWLIFAGYCIQTGALLFNYVYSLFKPIATNNLHLGLNLSELFSQSMLLYSLTFILIIAVSGLKAYVFYIILSLFKVLNLFKPFSKEVSEKISKTTYFTFLVGIISFTSVELIKKLSAHDYNFGVAGRYFEDNGTFLVMSAILFSISLIFKRGIELQSENDLTV